MELRPDDNSDLDTGVQPEATPSHAGVELMKPGTTDVSAELPTGTVSFLFTDMEGSTRLLQSIGEDGYEHVLRDHHQLLRDAAAANRGHEVSVEGEGFCFVFRATPDALRAAVAAQHALAKHAWPAEVSVRVRMGLHTGEVRVSDGQYVGLTIHQAARICAAAHGGQILVSGTTAGLVAGALLDLGPHRLRDISESVHLYQANEGDFPPPVHPQSTCTCSIAPAGPRAQSHCSSETPKSDAFAG